MFQRNQRGGVCQNLHTSTEHWLSASYLQVVKMYRTNCTIKLINGRIRVGQVTRFKYICVYEEDMLLSSVVSITKIPLETNLNMPFNKVIQFLSVKWQRLRSL